MMHQHNTDCKMILNNLSAYIDGELDEDLCQQIVKKTIDIYQKDGEKTTLPPDVRTRLFACLALEDDASRDE